MRSISALTSKIKEQRLANKLSQRELSKKVGIPQGHISRIEAGQVDLKLSSFIEIARTLGLELMLIPRDKIHTAEAVLSQDSDVESAAVPAYRLDDEGDGDD